MSTNVEPAQVLAPAPQLQGHMGFFSLVFTLLAYNGPMVVFLGFIPVAILLGNGIGTPVMFLACGIVACLFASGLVAMGMRLPKPGGFYTYVSAGLGKIVGLGSGFAAITCYYAALVSGYALGGLAAESLVHGVTGGPVLPWWVYGGLMYVVVAVLGYLNIAFSARLLFIFLALELLMMLIYNASVIAQGGAHGFGLDSFEPANIFSGSLSIAFLFGIGLYGGFEATVIFRDEVKQPSKTIPRATYAIVAILATLYSLTAWVFINAYGAEAIMAVLTDNVVEASGASVLEFSGSAAYFAATTLLLTSSFALSLASHNILSRYLFNLSIDGVLFRSLAQVHKRHGSPSRASAAVSGLAAAGIIAFASIEGGLVYTRLAGIYTFAFTLLLVLAALAITVFLVRDRTSERKAVWQAIATGISFVLLGIALVLAASNFGLLTGTEGEFTWILLGLILGIVAAGMVTASILRKKRPAVYARIGRADTAAADPEPGH